LALNKKNGHKGCVTYLVMSHKKQKENPLIDKTREEVT